MRQDGENVKLVIDEIRALTVTDKVRTGAVALVNLIPYAGGAIAAIIGETAGRRKLEKVCDVLSDLNARLEASKINPEQHLSKDQIIELVHETLQTASVTSDKEKLAALKRGLAYAFTDEDSFERKQVFLQVLRGCTSLELALLPAIYDSGDAYLIHEGAPPEATVSTYAVSVLPNTGFALRGEWRATGNRACDRPPLVELLAERIGFDKAATEGAARLLDGKGLANCGPNLLRQDCKILTWAPYSGAAGLVDTGMAMFLTPPKVDPTPLEASQTQFGRSFLLFCKRDQKPAG